RFIQGLNVKTIDGVTENEGRLSFNARLRDPWQSFTLEFTSPGLPYFVCEPNLSPPVTTTELHNPIQEKALRERRFFLVPPTWELPQADWSPPPVFHGSGSFASGVFHHTLSPPQDISIGTRGNPIVLILDPHWKYVQFQYWDRYYGSDSLDSPPRT